MGLRTARGRLFFFLFLVIMLPFLQHCFSFIESGKLNGAITNTPDLHFSYSKWWDGSYQSQKENFLNENTGFRPDLVRLNNQIDFSLFNDLHLNTVVMGKDGYLFSESYIYEYNGLAHAEDSTLRKSLVKLKYIQDTLARLGKTILFVEAASKSDYYPEKFPDEERYTRYFGPSVYSKHIRLADSLKINHIDINGWFRSMKKDNPPNPLFTRHGVHWSMYASLLVADTLIKYIDRARNISMPSLQITKMSYSDIPRYCDNDIAVATNLIFPLKPEKLCYPDYIYYNDGKRTMPKIIFIGDSFLWTLSYDNLFTHISKGWEFWYYFNEVWNDDVNAHGGEPKHIKDYDWQRSVSEADCIVLLYAPINLGAFHFKDSPIEALYNYYYPAGH